MKSECRLVITPIADPTTGPTLTFSGSDLVIGTNRTDSTTGPAASGALEITAGGEVRSTRGWIGYEPGTVGTALISGVGSLWRTGGTFNVGFWGDGYLTVNDGGLLLTNNGYIGQQGFGEVLITGVNDDGAGTFTRSTWARNATQFQSVGGGHPNTSSQDPGLTGTGVLTIENGGLMKSGGGYIAAQPGVTGIVTVRGVDEASGFYSEWQSTAGMYVGWEGDGTLNIVEGGQVASVGGSVGTRAGSTGDVTIDGEGSLWDGGSSMTIGAAGNGTLGVSNGGSLQLASMLMLGSTGDGAGTFNVGTGGVSGLADLPMIFGGNGKAIVNFNHVDNIGFSPVLTGSLAVNQMNTGETTLFAENDYYGITTVSTGVLSAGAANVFSQFSEHTVETAGTLDLAGFDQTVAAVLNAGLIATNGSGPGTILTVTGNYVGDGGTVQLNTYLGADGSASDLLNVEGDTSGTSNLKVVNAGGPGALTSSDGIKVIDVLGASNGQFSLLGDYEIEGQQAVVAGAHGYTLWHNGLTDATDGNWYLRSQLIEMIDPTEPVDPVDPAPPAAPIYQPGVPLYEAYPQALLALNGLPTLQQRVGDRHRRQSAAPQANVCGTTVKDAKCGLGDEETVYSIGENGSVIIEKGAMWGRIEGMYGRSDSAITTSGADYRTNLWKLQAGIDGQMFETDAGKLIGGITLHHGSVTTSVDSFFGNGDINTSGTGFGSTLTWYGTNGFYLDGQAQATWFDSDLTSATLGQNMAPGSSGFGYALSLEGGQQIEIAPNWALTPQAQLIYSNVDAKSFIDPFGASVSIDEGQSLRGRLGLALEHENSWKDSDGDDAHVKVYGIANLYNEFLDGTTVSVSGLNFTSSNERLWGGIGVGGSLDLKDDKYSVYGEVSANTSLKNFGDNYTLNGNLGLRVKF